MAAQAATQFEEVVLLEKLSAELERLTEWMEPHFRRREAHEAASSYVKALLSRAERKNTWGLSQEAGKEAPYAFQHLLLRASWDESTVRDDVLTYARQSLGEGGVLAVDETGFLKKGDKSAGVARQYTGTAGRIENSQVGVFMAYVTPQGHTLVDRELYLSQEWMKDSPRRLKAGIPEEVAFHTKPQLAQQMLQRAFDAGLRPSWVVGDEVYGRDGDLRRFLEQRHQRYVLAIASNTYVWSGFRQVTAGQVLAQVKQEDWTCVSAGAGSKGPRLYDWVRVRVNSHSGTLARWLLFRRSLTDAEHVAHYWVHAPANTSLEAMVRAAGSRWPVEECFESAKGEVGLDDYEVRSYIGWYRHVTLCLVAHAFLAAARVLANTQEAILLPKALGLRRRPSRMSRFRRRQGLDSFASRSRNSGACCSASPGR
ncbi:transposase, IS4 family [Stigmatella aurantiaca]|uniref:Transposase, IS4 family n=2 Tax=Stigmatella TaxID=40 RepID=A0A1H8EWT1_STIAU|nr:transposase, IS4 family [Stigmatella aurantiaca]